MLCCDGWGMGGGEGLCHPSCPMVGPSLTPTLSTRHCFPAIPEEVSCISLLPSLSGVLKKAALVGFLQVVGCRCPQLPASAKEQDLHLAEWILAPNRFQVLSQLCSAFK